MFFYSRRVGRAPQGEVPDAEYVESPAGTTILGAAKLTGKLSPTWNFGGLGAVTGRERARIYAAGAATDVEVSHDLGQAILPEGIDEAMSRLTSPS